MLKDVLTNDLKEAMTNKDLVAKAAIQMVKAAVLNYEKDNKVEATDDDVVGIIAKELKKRRDSLVEYEKSNRADLIEDLNKEISILLKYLPEQLSEDELREIVRAAVEETGAATIKDMGKVMGLVSSKVKGRADNKLVSDLVKEMLANN